LRSGELAGDAGDAAITAGDVSASRFADYGAQFCQSIEAMRKLVYAFYNQEFSFRGPVLLLSRKESTVSNENRNCRAGCAN